MNYQTTKGMEPQIRETGCYYLVLLKIFEKIAGISLSVEQINRIYRQSARVGYIGYDLEIKAKATRGLAQIISAVTGISVYMKRVLDEKDATYYIGHYIWKEGEVLHHHFVLMKDGKVIYDPWDPAGSRTVKNGKLLDYRFIFGEKL